MPTHAGTHYRLRGNPGDQPLVVLVHGVGLEHGMWRVISAHLEEYFAVLEYDLYGHGGSANPPGERSVADFIGQLRDLLDHVGSDRFSLVGFSLGSLIAQGFASLYPARLHHLALLHGVYQRTEEQCLAVRERCRITREEGPMTTVEVNLERWFSPAFRVAHPEVMDEIRAGFSRHTDDGYLKAYHLFAHAEPEMAGYPLDGVACPALVITGADDTGSTPEMSRAMARDLPAARLIINEGHRHMAPVENAARLGAQLSEFLRTD